jgi:flagellar biosynthesis protein FlgN
VTRMTREQAQSRLADGVRADLDACATMLELLERQFDAAVRHRSAQLSELAAELEPALAAMEQRRVQRVTLVRALHGIEATMADLIAALAEPARAALAADWRALEQMVVECKRMTTRNSALLAEQFSVMQRVLHGEDQLYAPR